MVILLSFFLFILLFALGVLHFYWAMGGKWALENALPQKESGDVLFFPKPFESIIVGIVFIVFGLFVLINYKILIFVLPVWLDRFGLFLVSFLFFIRAVGDFKYVGFFKKVKKTSFGILDTKIYSPLCFFIGVLLFVLEIV